MRESVNIEEGNFKFFSLHFSLRSMEIRSYVFIETEGKVDPCNEGYTWVPKSWSFVKFHEIRNFPTCVYLLPKRHLMA